MIDIPFQTIDWTSVAETKHPGKTGEAVWQTLEWPGLRLRLVCYSPGYLADHWCRIGHIVYCISGELITEIEHGEIFRLKKGMTYVVSDNQSVHRSRTEKGASLFILDGEFLR